jgi:RsiW-degrading membrane proteinase PrsW (M82 family)
MADTSFDWKKLVGGIAPVLGTALLGPLGGEAAVILGKALGLGDAATPDDVGTMMASGKLTTEQIVAVQTADIAYKQHLDDNKIELAKINAASDAALIADTSDARHVFGDKENVYVLGCIILGAFALLMALVLTGCFFLMTGRVQVDPSTMAVCSGLIGTVVGYVAANAQQVVSFFYGSSKGSKDSGQAMGAALTESIKQQAAR